jgi:hypothetical protein
LDDFIEAELAGYGISVLWHDEIDQSRKTEDQERERSADGRVRPGTGGSGCIAARRPDEVCRANLSKTSSADSPRKMRR